MFLENVVPSALSLALPDLEYIRVPEAIFTRTATNSDKKKCVSIDVYTKNSIHEESDHCKWRVRERERETALWTTLVKKKKEYVIVVYTKNPWLQPWK